MLTADEVRKSILFKTETTLMLTCHMSERRMGESTL